MAIIVIETIIVDIETIKVDIFRSIISPKPQNYEKINSKKIFKRANNIKQI